MFAKLIIAKNELRILYRPLLPRGSFCGDEIILIWVFIECFKLFTSTAFLVKARIKPTLLTLAPRPSHWLRPSSPACHTPQIPGPTGTSFSWLSYTPASARCIFFQFLLTTITVLPFFLFHKLLLNLWRTQLKCQSSETFSNSETKPVDLLWAQAFLSLVYSFNKYLVNADRAHMAGT